MERRADPHVAPPEPWQVDVVAPTHGHFDHVGDDAVDVVDLAGRGGQVIGSHELSLFLGEKGVEAVGMNKGGTFEAAGISFTMIRADHTGAVTLTGGGPTTREVGCWGWVIRFEDGTTVYHTGDTDVFGDMALVRERWSPTIAVLPIGGHYTMGPADGGASRALIGARTGHPGPLRDLPHPGRHPDRAGRGDRCRGRGAGTRRDLGGPSPLPGRCGCRGEW